MRFDDGAEGVLVGRADEVLADEATVLDAVLVGPVVVFDTDIELAGGVVQRLAEVVLDLRVEVEVLLQLAPPLPFTYLGKLIIDGEVVVFVSTPERNFAVRKGDLINGTYRIDRIAPPTLSLTYLPLNEKQTLEIGRAN